MSEENKLPLAKIIIFAVIKIAIIAAIVFAVVQFM